MRRSHNRHLNDHVLPFIQISGLFFLLGIEIRHRDGVGGKGERWSVECLEGALNKCIDNVLGSCSLTRGLFFLAPAQPALDGTGAMRRSGPTGIPGVHSGRQRLNCGRKDQ